MFPCSIRAVVRLVTCVYNIFHTNFNQFYASEKLSHHKRISFFLYPRIETMENRLLKLTIAVHIFFLSVNTHKEWINWMPSSRKCLNYCSSQIINLIPLELSLSRLFMLNNVRVVLWLHNCIRCVWQMGSNKYTSFECHIYLNGWGGFVFCCFVQWIWGWENGTELKRNGNNHLI